MKNNSAVVLDYFTHPAALRKRRAENPRLQNLLMNAKQSPYFYSTPIITLVN